jgi:hypothetical protein
MTPTKLRMAKSEQRDQVRPQPGYPSMLNSKLSVHTPNHPSVRLLIHADHNIVQEIKAPMNGNVVRQ